MSRLLLCAVAASAALSCSPQVFAGDETPPPWGAGPGPGQTRWRWDFNPGPNAAEPSAGSFGPAAPAANFGNGIGGGSVTIPAGGSISIVIPNFNMPTHTKDIYIQMHLVGVGAIPAGVPNVQVTDPAGGVNGGSNTANQPDFSIIYTLFISLPTCPLNETIVISNPNQFLPMQIDWLAISTRCIPTPGAAAMLGALGLTALRRQRR